MRIRYHASRIRREWNPVGGFRAVRRCMTVDFDDGGMVWIPPTANLPRLITSRSLC